MKKLLLLTTAMMISTSAMAQERSSDVKGLYISPKLMMSFTTATDIEIGGVSSSSDSDDSTFGVALAVGYDFNKQYNVPIRAELEFAYRTAAKDKNTEINANTLMFNAFYDFRNSTQFTPYVGGGVGVSFLNTEVSAAGISIDDDVANFTYNVGLGVNYEVNENVAVGLGYRYIDFGEAELANIIGITANTYAHEALLSLKYTF